jgi:hypothetical protein
VKVWRLVVRSFGPGGVLAVNDISSKVEVVGPDVTEASPQGVADAAWDWFGDEYLGLLQADWQVQELIAEELTSGADETAVHVVDDPGTLPASVGTLPVEVAGLLSVRTRLATRSTRGRMFLPSPMESGQLVAHDTWGTAGTSYGARCIAFGAKLLDGHDFSEGVIDYHMSFGIWSRKNESFEDATSTVFRTQPHWLRSRSTAP